MAQLNFLLGRNTAYFHLQYPDPPPEFSGEKKRTVVDSVLPCSEPAD